MSLRQLLRSIFKADADLSTTGFPIEVNQRGLLFRISGRELDLLVNGGGDIRHKYQYTVLRMLAEQGASEEQAHGFFILSEDVANIDDEQAEVLGLPTFNPYGFLTRVNELTSSNNFRVGLTLADGSNEVPFRRIGPYIYLTDTEFYRLDAPSLKALEAVEIHNLLAESERSEAQNLKLIAKLQVAKNNGMRIDLSHFKKLTVAQSDSVGVVASVLPSGGLRLYPSLSSNVNVDEITDRLGQLDLEAEEGVLRVGNQIVLLDKQKIEAVNEVLSNRIIPQDKVAEFMNYPTAFLDASLVNLELGFSIRVAGVGKFKHIDFSSGDVVKNDWFSAERQQLPTPALIDEIRSKEDLTQLQEKIQRAQTLNSDVIEFNGKDFDISSPEKVRRLYDAAEQKLTTPADDIPSENLEKDEPVIDENNERVTVVLKESEDRNHTLLNKVQFVHAPVDIDVSSLQRTPFPHQNQGISWFSNLLETALQENSSNMYRVQGGLLADDMGLGKTFMALVGLNQYYQLKKKEGAVEKPILVVAPLSLIENWEDEIACTFHNSPFRDVVVLQSGRDLSKFKIPNVRRESVQLGEMDIAESADQQIRYALYAGADAGLKRLDMDRRIILTTYQTLRDYQFSLCRIDWGVVVFDEAQNIKNPNTLQTHAAKGLKADFKLLVTGTPIENSLADFWCIVDAVQPGLLGSWEEYREKWISPIANASDEERNQIRATIGKELRDAVGPFMLRRTKESELTGLPIKTIYSGVSDRAGQVFDSSLSAEMSGEQLEFYDQALESFEEEKFFENKQSSALSVLMALRKASLHPNLCESYPAFPSNNESARALMLKSAKFRGVLNKLDEIAVKGEKVILFLTSKSLQASLKLWLDMIYGLNIGIINGDTKAVSTRANADTRKGMIRQFEAMSGFNILIMSPVAAGVGLTVVGANHVIHVERHWNPAKEAQASDRVYRIGQKRPVSIYLPASLHPALDSFDVHLDRLLSGKLMLKDAVVTPDAVSETEMLNAMRRR